jgi:hypothetical protein
MTDPRLLELIDRETLAEMGAISRRRRPAQTILNDPAVRDIVLAACRCADLSLNDSQIEMICAAAPYVMAMTRRLRRERDFREEPANIFQFPE